MINPNPGERSGSDRPKVASSLADDLRARIARGQWREGDPLPNESELMASFGVSRPNVRAALRILESESLIRVKAGIGGGARVRTPDVRVAARRMAMHLYVEGTSFRDMYEARSLLEPSCVLLIAKRHSPRVLRSLELLHRAELRVLDDPVEYPLAATRFHDAVVRLAGNKALALVGQLLAVTTAEQNTATFTNATLERQRRFARRGAASHAELLRLVAAGDANAAAVHWRTHLDGAMRMAVHQSPGRRLSDAILPDDAP